MSLSTSAPGWGPRLQLFRVEFLFLPASSKGLVQTCYSGNACGIRMGLWHVLGIYWVPDLFLILYRCISFYPHSNHCSYASRACVIESRTKSKKTWRDLESSLKQAMLGNPWSHCYPTTVGWSHLGTHGGEYLGSSWVPGGTQGIEAWEPSRSESQASGFLTQTPSPLFIPAGSLHVSVLHLNHRIS